MSIYSRESTKTEETRLTNRCVCAMSRIIKSHPTLDCVVLNAGIQRGLDFTRPGDIDLALVRKEIDTNYTSYVALTAAFLPHLQARAPAASAVVAVSSGLGLVPLPRCANYCATKAALHALMWSLRAQLAADDASRHVKVIEIVPPAVQVCYAMPCLAMSCHTISRHVFHTRASERKPLPLPPESICRSP